MNPPPNSPNEVGFISSDLAPLIADIRKHNAVWFRLAEDMNRTGQAVLGAFKLGTSEVVAQRLFAILLLIRSLSNHQGALIMAERGMTVEANTLTRCCYENAFCVGVLLKEGDTFLREFEQAEKQSMKSKANWILQEPARLDFSGPNAVAKLREHVVRMDAEWGKLTSLQWKDLADRGGLGDAYLYYKMLSGDSAHPSMSSLNRYVRGSATSLSGLEYGVDLVGIATTLNILCDGFVMVGLGVTQIIGDTARQKEFTSHAKIHARLNNIKV